MTETATTWVLTREHNEYNQYGEYFVAAWSSKPSAEQLEKELLKYGEAGRHADVQHVLQGGGRKNPYMESDVWYYLRSWTP